MGWSDSGSQCAGCGGEDADSDARDENGAQCAGCLLCEYLDGWVGLEGGAVRCVCEGGFSACGRGMVSFGCSEEGDGDGERASEWGGGDREEYGMDEAVLRECVCESKSGVLVRGVYSG